jgi:hypothetical protein
MQTVPRALLADTAGDIAAATAALVSSFRGHISGLTLSTAGASATFGVDTGVATSSNATAIMALNAATTKTTSAWAVGNGNGALDTGAIAINTWYYVHLIKRLDTGAVDILLSLSPTAPTLPAGYTVSRRIGAMKTNASSQWLKFVQVGDVFTLDSPAQDVNAGGAPGSAGTGYTLTIPPAITVEALFVAAFNSSITQCGLLIQPPFLPNQMAGTPTGHYQLINPAAGATASVQLRLMTSSGTFRSTSFGGGTQSVYINTIGWVDTRGKD